MIIGYAKLSLILPGGSSLKQKRQVVKSITERVKHRYNVSIAEISDQDLWQKATIGVSYVSLTDFQAKKTLRAIRDFIEVQGKGMVADFTIETVKS